MKCGAENKNEFTRLENLAGAGERDPVCQVSWRPIMVLAINDRMDGEESRRQMSECKEAGYGGVMIMPWGGMPYEFMSEAWLEGVGELLAAAKDEQLDVWLWDDWVFGSGFGGGQVTKDPRYRAKKLSVAVDLILEAGEEYELTAPARALSAGVVRVDKYGNPIGEVELLQAGPGEKVSLQASGRQRLVVVCWQYVSGMQHTVDSHSYFLDKTRSREEVNIYVCDDREAWSVDMLNPQATGKYIELIHERYYRRFGEYFGTTIKGFFYDEPKASSSRPWTEDFLERFERLKGYGLRDSLCAMLTGYQVEGCEFHRFLRPEKVVQAWMDYTDAWTTMLAESFYQPIQDWCRGHGVICSGHPLGDDNIEQTVSTGGCYFKNMAFSDMPGVDVTCGRVAPGQVNDVGRIAGSRAAALGKGRAMSESLAVYGHSTSVDLMRYVMEQQMVRGVNTFFNKLSNYNREKSLYFHAPEMSGYNPMIGQFGKDLHERIETLLQVMYSGETLPLVGVYVPVHNFYAEQGEVAAQIRHIAEVLTCHQVDFVYLCAEDILGMHAEEGRLIGAGGQGYETVLIPTGSLIAEPIQNRMREWGRASRGKIVVVDASGEGHEELFAKYPKRLAELYADDSWAKAELGTLMAGFRRGNGWIEFVSDGRPVSATMRRRGENSLTLFVLNESTESQTVRWRCLRPGNIFVVKTDSRSLRMLCHAEAEACFELPLAPTESKLLIMDGSGGFTAPREMEWEEESGWELGDWELTRPEGGTVNLRGTLPSWGELGYETYSGRMRYRTEFTWAQKVGRARLDLGRVCHAATVCVDGQVTKACAFAPWQVEIEGLSGGVHVLEVTVLNTMANAIFGTAERIKELQEDGAFAGTYVPIYAKLDLERLTSGLLGPVRLVPAARER